MKWIGTFLFLVISTFSLCGQIPVTRTIDDLLATCPTAKEIDEFNADVTISIDGIDPTAADELACREADGSKNLTPLQERAYQALRIFKYIDERKVFDAPLPWTEKKPLYEWFVGSIKRIVIHPDRIAGDYTDKTINVGVRSGAIWKSKLWLDPNEWGGMYDFMDTLIHEARHQNGPFDHPCYGADGTIEKLGAYAAELYWWEWLAEHSTDWFAPNSGDPLYYKRFAWSSVLSTRDSRFCNQDNKIALIPATPDFGDQTDLKATTKTVVITAATATPVTIDQIGLKGDDSANFKIATGACSGKTLLAQGWFTTDTFISCLVSVEFTPRSPGLKTAKITIASSAGSYEIPLSGTGVGDFSPPPIIRSPRMRPPENNGRKITPQPKHVYRQYVK